MNWISVGTLDQLKEKGSITLLGNDRPILILWNEGSPKAIDNRCPHMGFPLDQGTLVNGVLTCHWHHARFALDGGSAFDLFADDLITYDLRTVDGIIEVAATPAKTSTPKTYKARLQRGLEQNLNLIQAKSILGLLKLKVPTADILLELARFGSQNHDIWADGMTLIALIANLDPVLSDQTRLYALTFAANQIAHNCTRQPHRRERRSLENNADSLERQREWFHQWIQTRHRDGAERVLLTAAQNDPSPAAIQQTIAHGILQRIYLNTGHLFDFSNKSIELHTYFAQHNVPLDWADLLPLLIHESTTGQGEEDQGTWRSPRDLIPIIRDVEAHSKTITLGNQPLKEDITKILLGDDPDKILHTVLESLENGYSPVEVAYQIALAAAWRMAHFSSANELNDWFNPVHAFIYANATFQAFKRDPHPRLIPALFHGAIALYQDRFLNHPPAKIPPPESTETATGELLESLLRSLDHAPHPSQTIQIAINYIHAGYPMEKLVDTLTWATIREDLDFHKLQVLEAAYQLSQHNPKAETQALLFTGVLRHLAAHCPTPRNRIQSTRHALKLHRT